MAASPARAAARCDAYTSFGDRSTEALLAERCDRLAEQPAQLGNRHGSRLVHLQILASELAEPDRRPSAAGPDAIKNFAKRLFRLRTCREATDLRALRAASFEPVTVRPQRLTVDAFRLQLEHLTVLDHFEHLLDRPTGSRSLIKTTSSLERESNREGSAVVAHGVLDVPGRNCILCLSI